MAWWLEGANFKHFGWVRNPSKAIFLIFLEPGKNRFFLGKNRFFLGKNRFFLGKNWFLSKTNRFLSEKSAIFLRFFFFRFFLPKIISNPTENHKSPKNRPKKLIFTSLLSSKQKSSFFSVFSICIYVDNFRCQVS